jgi:hypothetical protein
MRRAIPLLAAFVGLWLLAPSAQGVTVGANLNRPANAPYTCQILPSVGPFGERFFLPSGVTTCTYVAVGALGNMSEVAQTPFGGGLVTQVAVRAGPVVGPMQATVSRAVRSTVPGVGFACCFYAGSSQVFTPGANAVTRVAVRLPVRADIDPQVGETVDYLGITVLAPNVPIPANEIGNPGNIANPGAIGFFPHLQPRDAISGRVDGAGIGGVQPLLSAEIQPFCGARAARAQGAQAAGPAAEASAGGPCAPFLGVGSPRLRGGRVVLSLLCNAPQSCVGRILLQSARDRTASSSARRGGHPGAVTYAAARVSISSGGSKRVKLKLSKAGRRLLTGRKRARVWANVRLSGGAVASESRRVTVRR